MRVHSLPGRVLVPPPVNLAVHVSAEVNILPEAVTLDVSQPTGMVLNCEVPQNNPIMLVTELTSHLDRC